MSADVSYWTGVWDPTREALSKEVWGVRAALNPGATVVSISAGQRSAIHLHDRVIRLSGRRWVFLRVLAALLERRARITHVIGEMHAWHLLRALGRRPILFTVAIPGDPLPKSLLDKVTLFVAESEPLAHALVEAGVDRSRIRIVHPGVDVTRFSPGNARPERFTVVFASSPASASHFAARGIPLLVEAARLCPDIDVRIMWRTWGDTAVLKQALSALNPPPNVISEWRDVPEMAAVYQTAHASAFLSAANYGKSCPNSVVEALACGCPAIVSESCGIGALLVEGNAGIRVALDPVKVAEALQVLRAEFNDRSVAARAIATKHFDIELFIESYRALYSMVGRTGDQPASL
jgi:glycosyltransferase involved in cell wall biosynthesis